MRWFIAAVALTVICAIFGSAAAFVLGRPSLPSSRADRQVVSLHPKVPDPLSRVEAATD